MDTLKHKRIVIIDDTPAIVMSVRASLEAMGAECHEAQTASGGLALCEQQPPDVITLDLGLPDKDGLHILSRLKKLDTGHGAPVVIVLTVRNESGFREKAQELGADAYLTKPFRMDELVELIHEKLHLRLPAYLQEKNDSTIPSLS